MIPGDWTSHGHRFCSQDNYWQVYFDTNRTIRESFGEAGFPAPELRHHVSGGE